VISLESQGRSPSIILTGDLNASPTDSSTGYNSLAYKVLKEHRLNFRSVLNDDVPMGYEGVLGKLHRQRARPDSAGSRPEVAVWTTWKARKKKNTEKVAKHCIDYILYSPLRPSLNPTLRRRHVGIRAVAVLDLYEDETVTMDYFPNGMYPSDHIAIAADLEIIEEIERD
jgi:exonuclease III